MQVNMRRQPRSPSKRTYSISWQDEEGITHSAQVAGTDVSDSGVGIRSAVAIRKGTTVYIQAENGHPTGYGVVRHATRRAGYYTLGLELNEQTKKVSPESSSNQATDYYEFLQISPKAQPETIQRVYRFLAARFHPDNLETGDSEKFLLLNGAYETLSDPERRARYDETIKNKPAQHNEMFESVDFLDGLDGELNRRLAVLSLLYRKCRSNVNSPQVSLLDLEAHMGFPRDYLDFTIWYLRSKKIVKQEDNAEIALTCLGVDYVEENYDKLPLLSKLLAAGSHSRSDSKGDAAEKEPDRVQEPHVLQPCNS
jgi:curved DNA-binding protein